MRLHATGPFLSSLDLDLPCELGLYTASSHFRGEIFLLFMWAEDLSRIKSSRCPGRGRVNSTQVFSHIKCSKSRLCRRVTFKDVFCIRGALMFIVSGRFFPHTNRWLPQCPAYKPMVASMFRIQRPRLEFSYCCFRAPQFE